MKDHRQARSSENFVQRVRQGVVRRELLHRRMELQSADGSSGHQPLCLLNSFLPAMWINAGKRNGDVCVVRSKLHNLFVRDLPPAGEPLIDGKNHKGDFSGTIIIRQSARVARRAALAEILSGRRVRGRSVAIRFEMHVHVNSADGANIDLWRRGHTILQTVLETQAGQTAQTAHLINPRVFR